MDDLYMTRPIKPAVIRAIEVTLANAELIRDTLDLGGGAVVTYEVDKNKGTIVYYSKYSDKYTHRLTLHINQYVVVEDDGVLKFYPILKEDLERRYLPIPISPEYKKALAHQRISAKAYDGEFE